MKPRCSRAANASREVSSAPPESERAGEKLPSLQSSHVPPHLRKNSGAVRSKRQRLRTARRTRDRRARVLRSAYRPAAAAQGLPALRCAAHALPDGIRPLDAFHQRRAPSQSALRSGQPAGEPGLYVRWPSSSKAVEAAVPRLDWKAEPAKRRDDVVAGRFVFREWLRPCLRRPRTALDRQRADRRGCRVKAFASARHRRRPAARPQ